jgi:2-polyprenyl-6-methoxyphenol hydroxylase-like FAD-dependent oxidoreductase
MGGGARSVLVVGGGISGAIAAIALKRGGHRVTLAERDPLWRALGSGITMVGPALRALDQLGLLDTCLAGGYGVDTLTFCDTQGVAQERIELPKLVGPDRPGLLGMMRPALHEILAERAQADDIEVRLGVTLESITDRDENVDVVFADGTTERHDLVIGADGLHSTVREQVFGHFDIVRREQVCFRAVARRPSQVTGAMWFVGDPDVHPGVTPVGPNRMYMFANVTWRDSSRPGREQVPAAMRDALADFGGLAADVRDTITDPELVNVRVMETLLVPLPWHRGRVVLAGDAAHTTTPHMAAGAAIAMEDGLVLAEELAEHDDIGRALSAYGKRRFERCRFVVETSAQLSHWQANPGTPGADETGLTIKAGGLLAEPY